MEKTFKAVKARVQDVKNNHPIDINKPLHLQTFNHGWSSACDSILARLEEIEPESSEKCTCSKCGGFDYEQFYKEEPESEPKQMSADDCGIDYYCEKCQALTKNQCKCKYSTMPSEECEHKHKEWIREIEEYYCYECRSIT